METEESEDGAGGNDNRNVEGILNLKEEKKLKKGKRGRGKRQDVQRGGHGAKEGGEQGRYVLRFGEQEEARALEGAILQ